MQQIFFNAFDTNMAIIFVRLVDFTRTTFLSSLGNKVLPIYKYTFVYTHNVTKSTSAYQDFYYKISFVHENK